MAKKVIHTELEDDFPSNSKSARMAPLREARVSRDQVEITPQPKVQRRAAIGSAVRRKKTFTESIARSFIGEQTGNVGAYILNDVLIPAAKNLIQEMVTSGIEMMLFGETSGRGRSKDRDRGVSKVSYGNYYKDRDDDRKERRRPITRGDKFDLDEIYFRHGDEATDVLRGLCDLLEDYEQVTVSDYFDLAGIDGATWAHTKYGWEDLEKAYCTHTRNGYVIVLPDPIELD